MFPDIGTEKVGACLPTRWHQVAMNNKKSLIFLDAPLFSISPLRLGENYTASIPMAVEHGVVLGSAMNGRISSAARQDYAEAAAAVLVSEEEQVGKIYELAGDKAYTLTELAAEVARQSEKSIEYKDMPEEDYRKILIDAGLPEPLAALLADSDSGASMGALFDDSHTLSHLIGRPTTPLAEVIASALAS